MPATERREGGLFRIVFFFFFFVSSENLQRDKVWNQPRGVPMVQEVCCGMRSLKRGVPAVANVEVFGACKDVPVLPSLYLGSIQKLYHSNVFGDYIRSSFNSS